jgi:hypothetical protein
MALTCRPPVKENDRQPLEINTNSFIVKVWLEQTGRRRDQLTWRGHITHVPEGKRQYVRKMSEITAFIGSYLDGMGINNSIWQRIKKRIWR